MERWKREGENKSKREARDQERKEGGKEPFRVGQAYLAVAR